MKTPLIQSFQQANNIRRFFTFTLSFILISHVFFTPTFAKGLELAKQKNILHVKSSFDRLSKNLFAINILLENKNIDKPKLKTLLKDINEDEKLALEQFELEKQKLISSNLPQSILSRHEKVVKHFKANMQKTKAKINKALGNTGRLKSIASFFSQESVNEKNIIKNVNSLKFTESSQPHEDKLPIQVIQANPNNKPKLKKQDFILSSLHSTPLVKYASLSKLDYSYLADASNPAYLSQSDEVVIDESIKQKAKELNYDAIKIYNYVKNNIIFTPTWGSSKNAPLTLSSKSGNAYDISSLLIALLRASDIPSRYVHGTIRVEASKFKN